MPTLLPVNEYELDLATSRMEETRENPTRTFVSIPMAVDAMGVNRPIGTAGYYTWQNGHWFDTGGNWIQDEMQVPEFARQMIEANRPVGRVQHGPTVTWNCPVCNEQMNQSESNAHLIAHYAEMKAQAGSIVEAGGVDKGERQVTAKNTVRASGER